MKRRPNCCGTSVISDSAYVDTGVLGSYFFPEVFSDETERLLQSIPRRVISNLTEIEFCSLAAKLPPNGLDCR